MIKGSSEELQESTISCILQDPLLLSKTVNEIFESYYSDPKLVLIFKSLKHYYNKYQQIPPITEYKVYIEKYYREEYGNLQEIKDIAEKLYTTKVSSEDYSYETVCEFIKRNRVEKAMGRIVDSIQVGNINIDNVADELIDSLNTSITTVESYKLSDISKIKDVRNETIGNEDSSVIVKFFLEPLNWCMQYKGLPPGTLNMIVAPPGRGKTTTLINQGVCTALQGLNVLHVFLGDMSKYDGLLRYTSCYSGIPTSKLVEMSQIELETTVKKINMTGILSHIYIASYAADEVTPDQLMKDIASMQRKDRVHYNAIIIDYDENFASTDNNKKTDVNSMYETGGTNYNRLALFAKMNKSVLFIAAQPKPEYWSKEILPMECAAESSKKQKIIDLMLTIGRPSKESSVGTVNIAKNRRGDHDKLIRVKFSGSNAKIEAITEDEYTEIRKKENIANKKNSQTKNGK